MVPMITRITPKPYNTILFIVDLAMSVTYRTHILPRAQRRYLMALIPTLLSFNSRRSSLSLFFSLIFFIPLPLLCPLYLFLFPRLPILFGLRRPLFFPSGVQRSPSPPPLVVFSPNIGDILQLRSSQLS